MILNKLDSIGFLEMTEDRIRNANINGNLSYCEFIITPKCNFNCPYCNKFKGELARELSLEEIKNILDILEKHGLDYLHLTGGEPTVRKDILEIAEYAKSKNMRIGMSTNGSANLDTYLQLVKLGVELFSISLDTDCNEFNKKFTGVDNIFDIVVNNIKTLSKLVYVNVGTVLSNDNIKSANDILKFISDLNIADIKLGTATQYNQMIKLDIEKEILEKHPILKYRVDNFNSGRNMRSLNNTNCNKCFLALDDISIVGNYHYPCAVYAREKGKPIGKMDGNIKEERLQWLRIHNTLEDPICKEYCMDFKCDFNDKFMDINKNICDILEK